MQDLQRTPSSSSCSSNNSVSSFVTSGPIPRKRVSPAQLKALNAMYHAKSHPSREERLALSAEIGMELKAVTIWLQNKRQTTKKNARVSKENTPAHDLKQRSPTDAMPLCRSNISLDHIARLSERTSRNSRTATLSPLAPRRINIRSSPLTHIDKTDLWRHMPSSPIAAPSSPNEDTARLSILPSRSRTMRSLEWACARARVAGIRDDEAESDTLPTLHLDGGDDTETENEEPVTPNTSADISPILQSIDCNDKEGGPPAQQGLKVNDIYTSGDVEAAMVLLGFMNRA